MKYAHHAHVKKHVSNVLKQTYHLPSIYHLYLARNCLIQQSFISHDDELAIYHLNLFLALQTFSIFGFAYLFPLIEIASLPSLCGVTKFLLLYFGAAQ